MQILSLPHIKQAAQQMMALVIGAAAGAVTGGTSETMKQGALTSYNAETYNRQLHQNEKERIKLLANGDEEKERRLEIAACALVHCSAQIPEDDPRYAETYEKAKALEQLGNTAEYSQERALLRKQTEMFSDSWAAGVDNKLFEYNDAYKALDHANKIDTKYGVTTRVGGVAQAVGGVAAMGVGVGLCETGFGCVAGVPVAAYGADNAYTGAKTVVTGVGQYTLGSQVLSQMTGVSQDTTNFIYSLPSFYTGAKPLLSATGKLGNKVVTEGSQMASAMGYVAGEVGKDVAAGYKAIPRPYKVAFGIEVGINTAAETIPYATGQREINSHNVLQSTKNVLVDSTYSAITVKAGDGTGAALDAAKGLIEGKSLDVVVSDVGASVWLSKSVGQFVKNEDAKRLITSGAKKVIESIQSKSETPNNEVKNEAK